MGRMGGRTVVIRRRIPCIAHRFVLSINDFIMKQRTVLFAFPFTNESAEHQFLLQVIATFALFNIINLALENQYLRFLNLAMLLR